MHPERMWKGAEGHGLHLYLALCCLSFFIEKREQKDGCNRSRNDRAQNNDTFAP
jgi:hypothetical protein